MRSRLGPLLSLACAGLVASSCTEPTTTRSACEDVELIVAASNDYASSMVCGAPGCVAGPETTGADLGADPMLASTNGRVFFVARDNDRLFELDPACGIPIDVVNLGELTPTERGRGLSANAHDVAAAPDGTLILPLYRTAKLVFVKDGKIEHDATIDLSIYDEDGNPQADAVSVVDVGGVAKAFVTLERLDDGPETNEKTYLRSTRPSQMLRVDVATRKPEAVIELAGRNPFNPMGVLGGALYLAEPGDFDAADDELAGIERFDTATSTTRLLVRERDLGGSVVEIAVTEGCGAAIVAGPEPSVNPTSLVTFDPDTGEIFATIDRPVLGPTPGYDLRGLAWRGDALYVGDRRRAPGGYPVRVFVREGRGCALTDTARTILLPQAPVAVRAASRGER